MIGSVVCGAESPLGDRNDGLDSEPGHAKMIAAVSKRTRDAMQHKKSHGQRVGNIAYGFRLGADGEQLEPEPQEQAVLTTIHDLRARRCTLRGIAAELNARGWRTRRASAWRLEHVARIVGSRKLKA